MNFLMIAAISGFVSVAMGAFGAHALKPMLTSDMANIYQTAAHYHLTHSIVLAMVGGLSLTYNIAGWLRFSAVSFLLGIILFSGSLYIYAISGVKWLGMITPIGGLALLIGWGALAISAYKISKTLRSSSH